MNDLHLHTYFFVAEVLKSFCIFREDALAIFWKCYESKVCNIPLGDPTPVPQECSDYEGDTYIELKYKCEPRK